MIMCGEKFVILGWGSSPIAAQQWTLLHILHTARTHGILHRAARHRCLPHVLLEADTATERVNKNYTHSTRARHTPTRLPRVPTAYGKLKWKTQELLAELKVRIIVTFAGHPHSKCGRLMSRALGVIVREVSQCTYTLCMPTMHGTRDMMSSLIRLRPQWEHSSHAEIDMYDQYWAISRRDVKAAFEWGLSRLRNKRHGHGIFEFSLSKLHRHLNRLGHALDETFDIVDETDVCTYLHWDLDHNTLLTICPMILTQSPVGVAIGGFLSSWEAELWCMWRESLSLHQSRTDTINRWRNALQDTTADTEACATLTLTFLQPAPFNTMHSHVGVADLERMRRRLAAATLTPPTVSAEGYTRWWHPLDTIWGFFRKSRWHCAYSLPPCIRR